MRTSFRRRASAATLVAGVVLGTSSAAHATGVTEFPDNGSEQGGRGGAWIARASDPLAVFYNPAGLAGQPTRLILQANINFQKTCFTRLKATNDTTQDPDAVKGGSYYPQVCSQDGAGLDPQVAFTYKLSDRVGLGIAPVLAPSGGSSKPTFPEFISTTSTTPGSKPVYEPAPNRYMLTSANLLVLTPTIGVGWEVLDRLRVGASFEWGIASLSFTNAVGATANTGAGDIPATSDVKAVANVHDYFFPGFTLGAIYSPTDDFDLAAWFKWSAPINAEGDIQTTAFYYSKPIAEGMSPSPSNIGNTALPNCGDSMSTGNPCGSGNNVKIKVAEPMEAKIGVRYHKRRSDVPYDEHVRDPMAQDIFDIETDLTFANDASYQNLQVTLPGNAAGLGTIPISGIPANAPPNANQPQYFKNVYGVRLGGDINVIRDTLALRGGGFWQSDGQNPQYQNIAFIGSMNFGLAGGATYRLHFSKVKANALEISMGYEHVFYVNETNDGPNGTPALAGTQCPNSGPVLNPTTCAAFMGNPQQQTYRTAYAINLGTITNQINVLNVGLGYKF